MGHLVLAFYPKVTTNNPKTGSWEWDICCSNGLSLLTMNLVFLNPLSGKLRSSGDFK